MSTDYNNCPFEIKVMRLLKPELKLSQPSTPLFNSFDSCEHMVLNLSADIPKGQNFSCIVNIINKTKHEIENVSYSVELITPRNTYQLKDRRSSHCHKSGEKLPEPLNPLPILEVDHSVNMIISQTLIEVGLHKLNVKIEYVEENMKRNVEKTFKFEVNNPLEVSVKAKRIKEKMYIETSFKNISQVPLIHEISFISVKECNWNVKLLENEILEKNQSKESEIFHVNELKSKYLLQGANRRYLYQVYNNDNPSIIPANNENIGYLSIKWLTLGGECGKLQTPPISIKDKNELIKMSSEELSNLKLNENFELKLKIENKSDEMIEFSLYLNKNDNNSFIFQENNHEIYKLKSKEIMETKLKLLPIKKGFFVLNGIGIKRSDGEIIIMTNLPRLLIL